MNCDADLRFHGAIGFAVVQAVGEAALVDKGAKFPKQRGESVLLNMGNVQRSKPGGIEAIPGMGRRGVFVMGRGRRYRHIGDIPQRENFCMTSGVFTPVKFRTKASCFQVKTGGKCVYYAGFAYAGRPRQKINLPSHFCPEVIKPLACGCTGVNQRIPCLYIWREPVIFTP